MKNLFPHYRIKNINMYEIMLILGIFFGVFVSSDIFTYARYILVLLVQIMLLLQLSHNRGLIRQYLVCMILVFFITVVFVLIDTDLILIINRIFPLISVYGIIIVGNAHKYVDIKKVICGFINLYVYLMIVVDLDMLMFYTTGHAIWKPISYIGYRAVGPQGDSNFLALYSTAVLLLVLHIGLERKFKYLSVIVLGISIILANSLSAYILFIVTIVLNRFISDNNRRKNIIILLVYFLGILFYANYTNEFRLIGEKILSVFYNGDLVKAAVKYKSLDARFSTQLNALTIFTKEWWGQGPRQLVLQLGLDTHNSYVGFMFEQGILGLFLIIFSLKKRVRNSFNRYLSLFLMLFAIVLNIHLTGIYTLFLLSQYYVDDNDKLGILGVKNEENTIYTRQMGERRN